MDVDTTRPSRPPRRGEDDGREASRTGPLYTNRRVALRRIDPWSVLKFSLVFYLALLVVLLLALVVFWTAIERAGLIDALLGFLGELQLTVAINPGNLLRAAFFIGVIQVIIGSALNVVAALLYNLVAEVLGGLRLLLVEES